jgi:putative lipase involved disintegration of autophagic bodies
MNAEIPNVLFHSGLLEIAMEIYEDVKQYIEWASPDHRIVFNGHSIGGSISILLLLLMTAEKGRKHENQFIPA